MCEILQRSYGDPVLRLPDEDIIMHPPVLLFGDFMAISAAKEDRVYEEILNIEKLKTVSQVSNPVLYILEKNVGSTK